MQDGTSATSETSPSRGCCAPSPLPTVTCFSTDNARNTEAERTCAVSTDMRKPRPRAPYPASVFKGRTAMLRCHIDDTAP